MGSYTQCVLRSETLQTTAWLPNPVRVGMYVRINKTGPIWKIVHAGTMTDETEIQERSRDYLHQREASDI